MFRKKIDFLAIGDIATDAFIKLKDAHVRDCIDHHSREICMKFADKIPFESVDVVPAVGNSANAAVSAERLGLHAALVSNLGDDAYGKECLAALNKEGVDSKFVKSHKGIPTNYHYVLWYDSERTILVKHHEYPRRFPDISEPKWIYLSSIGGNSEAYHEEIAAYLAQHKNIRLAFQPGTFQISMGTEKLKEFYARADIFFCNKEEAQKILKTEESDVKKLMTALQALGPKKVVITDGSNGAYALDGVNAYFMPTYPDMKPALERTGAGDAFSAACTVALAKGFSFEEALRWGPANSASVVQQVGAQRGLLTEGKLKDLISKAPESYRPQKI